VSFTPDGQNPYAPPAVSIDTRRSEAPLPDGVRRFRLDPPRYDRFQWKTALFLIVPAFVVIALYVAIMAAVTSIVPVATLGALAMAWVVLARVVRIRMARKSALETYELLVSDRAARRNLSGQMSAEILRPEVTRIVEVPTGLWLTCEEPPRSLFVANAIDRYDEARVLFSTWRPIERLGTFALLGVARREGRKQGLCDGSIALAADRSLQMDLTMLRSVSQTPGLSEPPSRFALYARLMVIWFALIFVFLALWQFLSPSR
jgi:hypothetical protein